MSSSTATSQSTASGRAGDRIFAGLSLGAGILILIVLACVAIFLLVQAWPALIAPASASTGGAGFFAYVWPFMVGTVAASLIAILLATPIGVGVALFISHYAHRRAADALGYVIDLLAAIPSVVYGAWGIAFLAPNLKDSYAWMAEHLGWIPLFEGPASQTGRTLLTAAIVLAVMILPIITSISRELFLQVPKLHEEAALALGATRWEMIRMSVLPFAKPGIISGVMLGLGRALGETMAVTLVLSSGALTASLIKSGNQTIPAEIALNFPEAFGLRMNELIAAGLILFIITLAVNLVARWFVTRNKEFSGAN